MENLINQETEQHQRSHLFTVRIWSEILGDGRKEWRGQVRYVINNDTRYFREWSTLVAFIKEKLSEITR